MSVFTHILVGSNDIAGATIFFDAVLAPLGLQRITFGDPSAPVTTLMYGKDAPAFMVTLPRDGNTATHANGGTIGFAAPSVEAVDAFHAAALAHGGTCEGEPGPRPNAGPNAYGAYIRDHVGNKLCAHFFG